VWSLKLTSSRSLLVSYFIFKISTSPPPIPNFPLVFTPLCKLFYFLQRKPGWLLLVAFAATALALTPLRKLEVRASATDLLPREWESVKAWQNFGRKFGSAGHLSVVVHSADPARNVALIEGLAARLAQHPGVNFLEYRTEAAFYRRHKLLYVSLDDLREVERRVKSDFWLKKPTRNPLLANLLDADEKANDSGAARAASDAEGFEDLEAKYFGRLKDLIGAADSTTLVLRIYPAFDVSDVHACRAFVSAVDSAVAASDHTNEGLAPEVLFTGEVVRTIQNEGKLFSRVLGTTRLALYLSAALLLINFLRFAAGALLALVPVSMAVIWTAALTHLWLGPLGIVSAPLSLLLIALGLSGAVHLLARYSEERRKGLGAETAFETITLETGPALAAGLLTLAAAFLTFRATEFRALADFGLVAGIGMVSTVVAMLAVFPSLLRLVEPTGLLNPLGKRLYNTAASEHAFKPYRHARLFLVIAAILTLVLLRHGPQWRFLHDFDALGFTQDPSARADSLLRAAGEDLPTPAVYLAPDAAMALEIAHVLRDRQATSSRSALGDVTTLRDLLPAQQAEKLRIIHEIRSSLTPQVIARARGPLRASLTSLSEEWPTRPLTVNDLPDTYRRKFIGPSALEDSANTQVSPGGVFTYAFPARDSTQETNLLLFAHEVRTVQTRDGRAWHAGGWPVVYGDLVSRMLPDTRKAMAYGLTVIFAILWVTVGSFRGAAILFLPVIATLLWTLGCIKWLGIKVNPYSLIAFPVALAYATLHGLILQHRYEEEGRGSLHLVLRRTGRTAFVATLVAAAAFVPMAFSDHYGLSTLGITALIGLACSLVATLLLLGGLFGVWEGRKRR
jgi:predicted RND superfamily exporter protein